MKNVAALLNKLNNEEMDQWLMKLESLGYKNSIGILNSGDFGSSQARCRVFMISSLNKKVELPIGDKKPKPLIKILDKNNFDKYLNASTLQIWSYKF